MNRAKKAYWPGWETVELIGRGSFGEVYKIQRDVLGDVEEAALKVISIPQNDSDIDEMVRDGYDEASITSIFKSYLKSIVAEYSLMRKMNGSSNIVNCDDVRYVQHDDGIGWDIFIKMELLTPLSKALPDEVSEEQVIRVGQDICAALEVCKRFGIVHRDIKPQNIFASSMGDYKLGDFGIAETVENTVDGTKIGTYKYMAPEVYNNQSYGVGADIYSLGLVLYWMLNERRLPFLPLPPEKLTVRAEEEAKRRRMSGEKLPPPAHGSEKLKRIVLKACTFDPKERFSSASEFLQAFDEDVPIPAPVPPAPVTELTPASVPPPKDPPQSNRKSVYALFGAGAALLLLVLGFFTIHIWTDVTCTESSVCQICGKTGTAAPGHSWSAATCSAPKTCSICGATEAAPIGHSWLDAACTIPKICSVCGLSEGTAAGHNWLDATCTAPKTCSICGKTEGSALEHQWNDATCEKPKHCNKCGVTRGEALGHIWGEASFISPKTCTRCAATEGKPMSHSNIDVEAEVLSIRETYSHIQSSLDADKLSKQSIRNGVDGYFSADGHLVHAVVYRGTEGIGPDSDVYSRSYYYRNGKLIFAFFEGPDSHRLYFYDEYLMRWLYRTGGSNPASVYHDFSFSNEFLALEKLAKDESASFFD